MDQFKKIKYSINNFEKDIVTNFLTLSNPKIILELGLYKGSTTKFILNYISKNNLKTKVYGFDLPHVIDSLIKTDKELIKHSKTKDLIFVPGTLPTSLELFLIKNKFKIDFVFIDAVGDFKNVFGELSLIWPYLSNDGYIICHFHKERLQYAVDSFAKKNQANYIPIFRQYANSPISGSIAVLSKPITKFSFLKRLNYIYRFNEKRGYYFFKRILNLIKLLKIKLL